MLQLMALCLFNSRLSIPVDSVRRGFRVRVRGFRVYVFTNGLGLGLRGLGVWGLKSFRDSGSKFPDNNLCERSYLRTWFLSVLFPPGVTESCNVSNLLFSNH